ncbi:MAG: epoxide hydrolase family protein [Dehalococcoidia bacterium]
MASSLLPFRLDIGERAIADLHGRLDATRWPEIRFDTGWSTGTNADVLRELVRYWRFDFDWFAVQERLNRLSHVRGPIEGDELHAVVLAGSDLSAGSGSRGDARIPLLLIHGWPGSFIELIEAGQLLSTGVEHGPAFDVVIPSLPGFGFSEPPGEAGMHPGRVAERLHLLMQQLGYDRYGVQGGDWGAIVGTRLARQQPEAVTALHLNFAAGGVPPAEGEEPSDEERETRQRAQLFSVEETGYQRIQGTRPQSLGFALNDSPVGLLAWILEKFWAWSDHGDDLWETFDRDDVLANVTLYWLTGTALSSARIYYEAFHESPPQTAAKVETPTGFARFPAEPWAAARSAVERSYNLVHWSEMPRGGHFAALEQPQLFAEDVAAFFGSLPRS